MSQQTAALMHGQQEMRGELQGLRASHVPERHPGPVGGLSTGEVKRKHVRLTRFADEADEDDEVSRSNHALAALQGKSMA
jgi:hypothetical protein